MDYIFWLIIGLVLMAIELVIPGSYRVLFVYVGRIYRPWWYRYSLICGARYHDCISRGIINLL